jgi:hypothetical protein
MEKNEKQRRKKILRELRQERQAEADAKMPLKKADLKALFDWVDGKLVVEGCDRTLRHTEAFLRSQGLPVEEVEVWLQDYGGFCDCEVIANVEGVWRKDYENSQAGL